MKNLTKGNLGKFSEQAYPIVIAILSFLFILCSLYGKENYNLLCKSVYDKILDSVISFMSVSIGFVGVLLGILFSIQDSKLVQNLFKHKSRGLLRQYFVESFVSGMIVIILSIIMYLRNSMSDKMITIFSCLWVSVVVWSCLSMCRIILLMINIIFLKDKQDTEKNISNIPKTRESELIHKYEKEM